MIMSLQKVPLQVQFLLSIITESLLAEAAASLAFWRSATGNAGPLMIYFQLLQPVILPES